MLYFSTRGNSRARAVNPNGELIGINTAIRAVGGASWHWFAILPLAAQTLAQLIQFGEIKTRIAIPALK